MGTTRKPVNENDSKVKKRRAEPVVNRDEKILEENKNRLLNLVKDMKNVVCQPNCDPIYTFGVEGSNREGPPSLDDWTFSPVDANMGAGGDWIYIGYKTSPTEAPVTDVVVGRYSEHHSSVPSDLSGFRMDFTDLNMDAGGDYLYLAWRSNGKDKPIRNMMLLANDNDSAAMIDGWERVRDQHGKVVDLNKGAGGKYIWMYVSRVICPNTGK